MMLVLPLKIQGKTFSNELSILRLKDPRLSLLTGQRYPHLYSPLIFNVVQDIFLNFRLLQIQEDKFHIKCYSFSSIFFLYRMN